MRGVRSSRRTAFTLAVFAASAGCAAIAGIEPIDYRALPATPDEGGGGIDGGGRDSPPSRGPSVCTTKAATAAFCEDFDPPAAAQTFTFEEVGGGTARVDGTAGYSAPAALRLTTGVTGTAVASTPVLTGSDGIKTVTIALVVAASAANHVFATAVFPVTGTKECHFVLRSLSLAALEAGAVKREFTLPQPQARFTRYELALADTGPETEVELKVDGTTVVPKTMVNCDMDTEMKLELGARSSAIPFDDYFDNIVVEITR